jgi:Undecaprenyl-phosphate glucose phosphotransferase
MKNKTSIIKSHLDYALMGLDFILVILSSLIGYWLRFGSDIRFEAHLWEVLAAGFILVIIFRKNKLYTNIRGRSFGVILTKLFKYWILWVLIICLFAVLTKTGAHISRIWLTYFTIGTLILTSIERFIIYKSLAWMRANGLNQKNVLFIGSKMEFNNIKDNLDKANWSGFNAKSFLETSDKLLNKPNALLKHIQKEGAKEIWIGLSLKSNKNISETLNILKPSCIQIRIIPMLYDLNLLNHSVTEIADMAMINIRTSPLFGFNKIIKYTEDKIISAIILILISPIMLIIAGIIKLTSKGPVFYKQERLSWDGQAFNMLKFRSMPQDTEDKSGAVWAKSGERRATRFGSFLRKTSLDELPQFINVIKGDMSIVGPRPERPVFVEKFKDEIPNYMQKHLVKAGITGWAQINGWRGDTDLKTRIEYDLFYIDNWSVGFDLKIIFLTIFKGFISKNAY